MGDWFWANSDGRAGFEREPPKESLPYELWLDSWWPF